MYLQELTLSMLPCLCHRKPVSPAPALAKEPLAACPPQKGSTLCSLLLIVSDQVMIASHKTYDRPAFVAAGVTPLCIFLCKPALLNVDLDVPVCCRHAPKCEQDPCTPKEKLRCSGSWSVLKAAPHKTRSANSSDHARWLQPLLCSQGDPVC